ncbi:MAG: hypothetical protein AAF483_04600, partial [Planctomycetota bacterium]
HTPDAATVLLVRISMLLSVCESTLDRFSAHDATLLTCLAEQHFGRRPSVTVAQGKALGNICIM